MTRSFSMYRMQSCSLLVLVLSLCVLGVSALDSEGGPVTVAVRGGQLTSRGSVTKQTTTTRVAPITQLKIKTETKRTTVKATKESVSSPRQSLPTVNFIPSGESLKSAAWNAFWRSRGVDPQSSKYQAALKRAHLSPTPAAEPLTSTSRSSSRSKSPRFQQRYPQIAVTNAATAAAARRRARYPFANDVPAGGANEFRVGAATYRVDAVTGRVTYARSHVAAAIGTNPSAGAVQYCDTLYNPVPAGNSGLDFFVVGGQGSRVRDTWQTGHIIAAGLGGTNDDPFNFFPQHHLSNGNNGRWWRAELIAADLFAAVETHPTMNPNDDCRVSVHIWFEYNNGGYVPSGGTYMMQVEHACAQALVGEPGIGLAEAFLAGRDQNYQGTNIDRFDIPWVNGPNMAYNEPLPAGVLADAQFAWSPELFV